MFRHLLTGSLLHSLLLSLASLLLSLGAAQAELDPRSVVILANKNSSSSLRVAEEYRTARNLDTSQLVTFDIAVEETISRKDFDEKIKAPLRAVLEERGLATQTRVLVSMFDMPLRVAAPDTENRYHDSQVDALRRRDIARSALFAQLQALEKQAGQTPSEPKSIESDQVLVEKLREMIRTLVKNPPKAVDATEHTKAMSAEIQKMAGTAGLLGLLRVNEGNEAAQNFLNMQKSFVENTAKALAALEQMGASEHRELVYQTTAMLYGAIGVLSRANAEAQRLSFTQADASFDSELALLWWDSDMYPLSNRLPNPWFLESENKEVALPILMTSRIDGPSVAVALQMIKDAIKAEKDGLEGTVFVDARGMKTPGDEFFIMDEALRSFGWTVRSDTDYDVYIEDHDELLQKAEDAAIYVGWYSVGKFQGDFSFNPGAIAYHIASAEAISVRDPNNTGWCKNLLQRGAAATLGAIDEPYLDSFPQPERFIGLMMTGKYSLAEAYILSTRHLSWRLALFGDPLYNPWRGRAAIDPDDLELPKDTLPTPPGELDLTAAFGRREQVEQQRGQLAAQLQYLLDQARENAQKKS